MTPAARFPYVLQLLALQLLAKSAPDEQLVGVAAGLLK